MSFDLQLGHVGNKERFVTKRYIEEEYKEQGIDTCLWVEKRHQNGVRGGFFKDFEDLLREDMSIRGYKSFEDFVLDDCGSQGQIDSLIIDNIDENKDDRDFSLEELKKIVQKYYDSEIVEALKNLKEDEKLYILSDCNGEYMGIDKNSLILNNLVDGQYYRIYSTVEEIIEAIAGGDEIVTVYIYNYMSHMYKEKYKDEYAQQKCVI